RVAPVLSGDCTEKFVPLNGGDCPGVGLALRPSASYCRQTSFRLSSSSRLSLPFWTFSSWNLSPCRPSSWSRLSSCRHASCCRHASFHPASWHRPIARRPGRRTASRWTSVSQVSSSWTHISLLNCYGFIALIPQGQG